MAVTFVALAMVLRLAAKMLYATTMLEVASCGNRT